jgi:hypothetical protein
MSSRRVTSSRASATEGTSNAKMSRCRNFLGPSLAVDGSSILLGEFGPTINGTMAPSRGGGHNCHPSRRAAFEGTWPD